MEWKICDQLIKHMQNIFLSKLQTWPGVNWVIRNCKKLFHLWFTMPLCFTLMPIKSLITLYKGLLRSDQIWRIFGWHHNNPECYFGPLSRCFCLFRPGSFFTVSDWHWSRPCWCCSPRWPPSRIGWSGSCTSAPSDTCSCETCPQHTCSTQSTCPGPGNDHWALDTRSCCLKRVNVC